MIISIVTISFNQSTYIRQCIDSILCQLGPNDEYIIVDPGSNDGSREIINSYIDSRIIKVFEPDSGPADGLNKGFSIATGDIYGFINSDDYLLPGALNCINSYFEKNGLSTFVSGSGWIEYENGRRLKITPNVITKRKFLYGLNTIFQQGTFFPSAMFKNINGFNPKNTTSWDGEFFLDLVCSNFRHTVIKNDLAVFRIYSESISGSGRTQVQSLQNKYRIFSEKMGRKYGKLDLYTSIFLRISKKILSLPIIILTKIRS